MGKGGFNPAWEWEESDSDEEESKKRKTPPKRRFDDDDNDTELDDMHYPGQAMNIEINPLLERCPPMPFRSSASTSQGNRKKYPPSFGGGSSNSVPMPFRSRASTSHDKVSGNKQKYPSPGSDWHNPIHVDLDDSPPNAVDDDEYAKQIQLAIYQSVNDDDVFERHIQLAINRSMQTSDRPHSDDLKKKGVCISHPLEDLDKNYYKEEIKRFGVATGNRGEPIASVCVICGDDKSTGSMKKDVNCSHFFCPQCIHAYVWEKMEGKIENTDHTSEKCPHKDCKQILSANHCREFLILPKEVMDRWENEKRVGRLLAEPKYFECPFEDCSRQILDDELGFLIRACPFCWRIFCMRCRETWHMGLTCTQYQRMRKAEKPKERFVKLIQSLGLKRFALLTPDW